MRIHVNYRDIDDGEPGSPHRCPIALALKRKLKTTNVRVTGGALIDGHRFSLPAKARDFISDFDEGRDVEPLVFNLDW